VALQKSAFIQWNNGFVTTAPYGVFSMRYSIFPWSPGLKIRDHLRFRQKFSFQSRTRIAIAIAIAIARRQTRRLHCTDSPTSTSPQASASTTTLICIRLYNAIAVLETCTNRRSVRGSNPGCLRDIEPALTTQPLSFDVKLHITFARAQLMGHKLKRNHDESRSSQCLQTGVRPRLSPLIRQHRPRQEQRRRRDVRSHGRRRDGGRGGGQDEKEAQHGQGRQRDAKRIVSEKPDGLKSRKSAVLFKVT
jgi:hypothetical protein